MVRCGAVVGRLNVIALKTLISFPIVYDREKLRKRERERELQYIIPTIDVIAHITGLIVLVSSTQ